MVKGAQPRPLCPGLAFLSNLELAGAHSRAGKKIRAGYSATDLNQILGVVPGTEDPFAAAAAFAVSAQPAGAESEDESEEEAPQPAKKAKKEKAEKKDKKKKRKGKESDGEDDEAEEEAGRAARSASEREATVSAGAHLSACSQRELQKTLPPTAHSQRPRDQTPPPTSVSSPPPLSSIKRRPHAVHRGGERG